MPERRHTSRPDSVERAIAELRSIRSSDPSTAIAMSTIKATVHTLETHWLGTSPDGRDRAS